MIPLNTRLWLRRTRVIASDRFGFYIFLQLLTRPSNNVRHVRYYFIPTVIYESKQYSDDNNMDWMRDRTIKIRFWTAEIQFTKVKVLEEGKKEEEE